MKLLWDRWALQSLLCLSCRVTERRLLPLAAMACGKEAGQGLEIGQVFPPAEHMTRRDIEHTHSKLKKCEKLQSLKN